MIRSLLAFATLFTLLIPRPLTAQSDVLEHPRFETGVNLTILRNSRPGDVAGIGGHFGMYLNKNVALEGDLFHSPGLFGDGPHGETVGLFGAKAGWQSQRMGVFLKLRPGFLHCGSGSDDCGYRFPARNTFFALDFGGVLELYPAEHVYTRFDLGDTAVSFGNVPARNLPGTTLNTRHYITGAWSFGVRF